MADNILKGIIKIEAPGVAQTASQVSSATGKMEQGFKRLTPSSNQATNALTNVGRVAQDLPFGFIGVANNITPLIESFQRLAVTSKETGRSIGRELLQSLKGGGGLILAFSLATSAIQLLTSGFQNFSKKAKQAKDDTEDLNKTIKESFASVAQEAAKVETLVAFIKLETTSRKERVNAIKELQSIAPGYFAMLDAEKASIGQITLAYNAYVSSLLRAAEAKVLEKQLGDIIARRLELQSKLSKVSGRGALESEVLINGKLVRVKNAIYDVDGLIADQERELIDLKRTELGLSDKIAKLQPPKLTTKDFAPLKDTTKESEIIARAKRIYEAYKDIFDLELNILPEDTIKTQLQKAKVFIQNYLNGNFRFTVPAPDISLEPPPEETRKAGLEFGQLFFQELQKEAGKVDRTDFSLLKAIGPQFKSDAEKLGEETAEAFNEGIKTGLSDGLSAIAEGVGGILGGANIKDAFSGFANAIAGMLQSIGRQFISIGVAAILAKEAIKKLFANPFLAVAAGTGLIAAGAALKAAISNFGGFRAAGGPVSAGKSFVVGENGPELFSPGVNGSIIPNHQLSSFSGGGLGGMLGQVVFKIGMNELVGILATANRSQTRLR